ncbi:MAG TPA: thioredoxin family protein [Myxococcaceae bacterium]|nr:thioredoxin family protein [Myxococcaceae bacterium]
MATGVEIVEADPQTFDALTFGAKDLLVVVDFWGENCPNCEVFARELPHLLEELGDVPLRIVKVDAYTHDGLATRFGLHGIPTFLVIRDGKLLGKMSQYRGRAWWLGVVRDHLPGAQPPASA